jgi:hypothetical protein
MQEDLQPNSGVISGSSIPLVRRVEAFLSGASLSLISTFEKTSAKLLLQNRQFQIKLMFMPPENPSPSEQFARGYAGAD